MIDCISWKCSDLFVRLQFADGEILMHVFDISYNQLTGPLPSFLDFTNVPEYTQRGIYIAVSLCFVCAQNCLHCVTYHPLSCSSGRDVFSVIPFRMLTSKSLLCERQRMNFLCQAQQRYRSF